MSETIHGLTRNELLAPHEDNCGTCEYRRIMHRNGWSEAVREGDRQKITEIEQKIEAEWSETKYYKLSLECKAQGLDLHEEARKRGWTL